MSAEDSKSGSLFPDDFRAGERPRSPAEALEPARAPEPPRGWERKKVHPIISLLNGLMTLLVVAMLGAGALFYFAKLKFDAPGPLDHAEVAVVPKGAGVNAIATLLEREGIISDRRIFVASVIYFKAQDKLKAGEYEFRKQASMRQVLDTLVEGRAILYKVTIPEGLTSEQIVQVLGSHEMLNGDIQGIPPEGSLLPDTYKFSRGTNRSEMIERMQAEQRKFVSKLWAQRHEDLPFKTPQEALILASIVEKETGRVEERPRVASVFINRLKKNMRLQSDPTIIYGLVGGKGPLGRPIRRSELDRPTPYNTYQNDGLPPTPIANPGRAAIEAVLKPAMTDDLYFVADGTGGHAFSSSLNAHNNAVANWRVIERERRAKEEEQKRLAALAAKNGEAGAEQSETNPDLSLPADLVGPNAGSSGAPSFEKAEGTAASTGSVPLPIRNPRLR